MLSSTLGRTTPLLEPHTIDSHLSRTLSCGSSCEGWDSGSRAGLLPSETLPQLQPSNLVACKTWSSRRDSSMGQSLEWLDKRCYEKIYRGLYIGYRGAIRPDALASKRPRGLVGGTTVTRTKHHAHGPNYSCLAYTLDASPAAHSTNSAILSLTPGSLGTSCPPP